MFKKQNVKFSYVISIIWIIFLLLEIMLYLAVKHEEQGFKNQNKIIIQQVKLVSLSYKLKETSNYLTDEVRMFVVTFDQSHMKNYLKEINLKKTRSKIIEDLIQLKPPKKDLALIIKANQNSNKLVNTEMRAIKLILLAQNVPKDKMPFDLVNFELSENDLRLPQDGKVWLARRILFDKAYNNNKKQIMEPIEKFKTTINEEAKSKILRVNANTEKILYYQYILTISIFGVIGLLFLIFNLYAYKMKKKLEQYNIELEEKNESLKLMAHFDQLTRLPNRQKLFLDTRRLINKKTSFSLLLVDIERFRDINSFFTNKIGDLLLIDFVKRYKTLITSLPIDIKDIYRLNGDEFYILIGYTKRKELENLCREMIFNSEKPFEIENESIKIGIRIACSTFGTDDYSVDALLNNCKRALSILKRQSIEKTIFYSQEMEATFQAQYKLEKDLKVAFDRNELELHYQPQYSIEKKLVGFEALVRWNHPLIGRISPLDFIPLAEETGLIVPLGEWVLKESCNQLKEWLTLINLSLQMSVNVSVRQLQQADFCERVKTIVQNCQISPGLVMLEVTETYPFYADENIVNWLKKLREEMGFKISIDDFGTGYCSLTSLTKLPIDQIKISREYVNSIGTNTPDEILLNNTIRLSRELQLEIIAEGVETEKQLEKLITLQCHLIQGYYFSPPLEREKAQELFCSEY